MKRFARSFSHLAFVLGAWVFISGINLWADPSLPTLFTDHMVLQRGREIHIWGNAEPQEKITATLAGYTSSSVADAQGHWSTHMPAMTAGGPFTLTVHGKKEVVIKDVLIGDVWIASGQSNMTYSLDGAEGAATEVPKANYPQMRLFTVPRRITASPQDNTRPAHWEICTPESAKGFSAVAYYFAREIQRKEKIPIGLVESAWPGTAIQEWIAPEALRADPELKSLVTEWDGTRPSEKEAATELQPLDLEFDNFELIPVDAGSAAKTLANFDDGSSRLSTGGTFAYSWADARETLFELVSPGRSGKYAARVAGKVDGTTDSILSATYSMNESPADLAEFAGIRFWVRGSGSFRFRSKQPTITDYDDYATPLLKATPDWQQMTIRFRDLRQDGWGVVKEFTQAALTGFAFECVAERGYAPMPVSALYEGMITPLLDYQFRGALWYQGESNALEAHQYRKLLPALIRNWRDAFRQSDLAFLIVQLPNHGEIPVEPKESAWAELREAELMTVKQVPNTGLAVTIDVGDPNDLHPHRKREVGERLATWALGTIYHEDVVYSGPLYESMKIDGSEMRIRFSHIGSGLEARGDTRLEGFAVAGSDRKFHWADALIDGDSVVVSSPQVPAPVAVRYAWGDSPECNLYNKDGLPASPFRTDDWPGITDHH